MNYLARRGKIEPGSELFGKAFENWVFHELSVHSRYSEKFYDLSYWRTSSGIEVDYILGNGEVAIEAKGKEMITTKDMKGLYNFKKDFPEVKHLIIVSLVKNAQKTKDGIHILPHKEFIKKLWKGEFI